ncbi:MAG: DDE-type integrase/transposase/recombinase [Planctomycetia bacterium]|nr:DDE-type integrase/transposase/recombinase [Planctomycetia bacterium]MCC7315147.1 DDE-type integrase/transposase/recombinase [Planctomycetota bacterium]OQY96248.1 MAG: hypothetical protein B6D36_19690 [Planctomycetes bacterium UTPLA1]
MSLPAQRLQLSTQPADADWITLAEAAKKLGITVRACLYRCEGWQNQNLARKFAGQWQVHVGAAAALRTDINTIDRDLHQLGELRRAKVPPRHIKIAEARRDIIVGFAAFRLRHRGRSAHDVLSLYVGECYATGMVGGASVIKKLSASTFYVWAAKYEAPDGGLAALAPEYNGGDQKPPTIGAEAWGMFLRLHHGAGSPSMKDCWRLVDTLVRTEHKGEDAWAWGKYRTVLKYYAANVHPAEAAITAQGPYRTEASFLPKIARSIEHIAAGTHLCGDERIFDFMARVAGARGWERCRVKVTAWMCVRSRKIAGWIISEDANSDTILSSFRMACEAMGTLPNEVTIDNGRDYRAVAGKMRRDRKWDEFDSKRVLGAFERLKIETHFALKKHPWSKSIESRFNTVKDRFDRFFAGFWGGTHSERPWDAERWTNEFIDQLPTVEEVRDQFEAFIAAMDEETVEGDGMFGLCPRQAMARYFTATPRLLPADVLELACSRMFGPRKVGRDGIRHKNIRYGKLDKEVWRLMGKEVFYLADPVNAQQITLCDEDGIPICVAFADRNLGMTQSELRAAENMRKSAKRQIKKFHQVRDDAIASNPQLISKLRRRAAKLNQIPDSQVPAAKREGLRLVGGDSELAAGVEKIKRAAGAEAIKKLSDANAAAQALNEFPSIDLRNMPGSDAESASEPERHVDFRCFSEEAPF